MSGPHAPPVLFASGPLATARAGYGSRLKTWPEWESESIEAGGD